MENRLCVCAREVPPGDDAVSVGALVPCFRLGTEAGQVLDSACTKALAGEQTDFHLGLIEPAAVLGSSVDGKAAPERDCFL